MALAARLMDAVDGQEGPLVIQKFVKYRGRRPCIYRAFWRAASGSSPRAVTVWNISSAEPAAEFRGAAAAAAEAEAEAARAPRTRAKDKRKDLSELVLLDGPACSAPGAAGDVADNAAFRRDVDAFVDCPSPLDRSAVVRAGLQAHRLVGPSSLCSLTDPDGAVSDNSANKVRAGMGWEDRLCYAMLCYDMI
jgi:hypothetical protein